MIEKINLKNGSLDYNSYDIDENKPFKEQIFELNEDLIQIGFSNDEVAVDVGWYPSLNPRGYFKIVLIYKYDWNYPLYKKTCKSVSGLVQYLQGAIDLADEFVKVKENHEKLRILRNSDRYNENEKYFLFIFKRTGILYSWETVYIGIKLNVIYKSEMAKFISLFCKKYPQYRSDEYVKKLMRNSSEKIIHRLFIKIMKKVNVIPLKKESQEWKLEVRKWRYCILNEMKKYIEHNLLLWTKVYDVYTAFCSPQDMEYLIKPMYHADLLEKEFNKLPGKLNAFLKKEKLYIKNEQHYSKN